MRRYQRTGHAAIVNSTTAASYYRRTTRRTVASVAGSLVGTHQLLRYGIGLRLEALCKVRRE